MPITPPPCLCGSKQNFSSCCEPLIKRQTQALTAQALMRSRYTAYSLGYSEYILQTWAPDTRPLDMDLTHEQVKWLGLEIHGCKDGLASHRQGEVEFTATSISAGYLCTMRENSRFIRSEQSWYYLDGRCEITRKKLDRNSPCPCHSGKKFKRCCGVR